MTTLLILEGNATALVEAGKSDALPFAKCFMSVDPSLSLRVANPYARDITLDDLTGVDGVVFTGSGVAWSTAEPEAEPLRAAMRTVFETGLPVWGSCNGMQLAAVVLGGRVGASPKGSEIGVAHDIQLTDAGATHPMMSGKASGFVSPCVHRDEVQDLPEGAVLLAGNDHSPVQAFAYAKDSVDFWGVQYHPECDSRDMAGWLRGRGAETDALVADLEVAETDSDAAARLGTTPNGLTTPERARELINWVQHVKTRADCA
ncbi:MAG: type 1 glutamine amidotransferase [Shimia thalassica]|uniref:type 1 glutamine amidotransferase n=1 Tax=Shimia thalassica TaxID=1715693 RepID=UPI0032969280